MTTPAGFAPVFKGWNVWDLWQADDPDESVLGTIWHAGESPERLLRVWVEDELADNAPGVAVADPLNPAALKGEPVQVIPRVTGLAIAALRHDVPELAGALQLGNKGSTAALHTVRFFNRGDASALPWPHDKNFVLETVYEPSSTNEVTNAPPPGTLAGGVDSALHAAGNFAESAVEAIVVLGLGYLLIKAVTK